MKPSTHPWYKNALLGITAGALCAGAPLAAATPPAGWTRDQQSAFPALPRYDNPYGYIVPFGASSYAKFGFSGRVAWEDDGHLGYGDRPSDAYVWLRGEGDADFRFDNNTYRAYLQLGTSSIAARKHPLLPIDASNSELQMAFVDIGLSHGDVQNRYLRVGRQQLLLDHLQWTTATLFPNVQLYFDGVHLKYTFNNRDNIQFFALRKVRPRFGSFNDTADHQPYFFGTYNTIRWTPHVSQDVFFLGLDGETVPVATMGVGYQHRYSYGTRFYGNVGDWHYDVDGMYQNGVFKHQRISAWGFKTIVGYTFKNAPWRPTVQLRVSAASGKKHPGATTVQTFDPLFPATGFWYGNANDTELSNLFAYGPMIRLHPVKKITVSTYAYGLRRMSTNDCVYFVPVIPTAGTCGPAGGYNIGVTAGAVVEYHFNSHLIWFNEVQDYFNGKLLRTAGDPAPYFLSSRLDIQF